MENESDIENVIVNEFDFEHGIVIVIFRKEGCGEKTIKKPQSGKVAK
ncbi:hypothetical protein [Flavobacterium suzhouense]|uniref:Uncharacterized protein n=1 Tax=Flavobacterium suzhouense TaxID=1529638 RepID=A0ABW5NQM4_9FLAO